MSLDLSDPGQRKDLVATLGELLRDRLVVHGPRVLAGAVHEVTMAAAHGARASLVLATIRGAGEIPAPEAADVVWLPPREFALVSEELRAEDERIRSLPPHVADAVDAFDPDREALWWGTPFTSDLPVLGRRVVGGRPASWLALEDKIVAEEIWQLTGVDHAPSRVVDVVPEALDEASRALDRGDGVVWAGDNRGGFHGGGNYVRWVASEHERRAAYDFFVERCDRVRVQPFLDGVPCSIHGYVLDDGTAAFRPVEIAMLRRVETHEFVYGGLSSFWDPPAADRETMRSVVRRVGEHLRHRVGYRGFFGIDGVLTADGFVPTELNPRVSAGVMTLTSALPGADDLVRMLQLRATPADPAAPELTAADLETIVPAMDRHRSGRVTGMWQGEFRTGALPKSGDDTFEVAWDGAEFRRGPGDTLSVAPTSTGLFALLRNSSVLRPGQRLAPLNVGLMRFLDAAYGTGFGDVQPAPDRRG
jgi:hypothetical protein